MYVTNKLRETFLFIPRIASTFTASLPFALFSMLIKTFIVEFNHYHIQVYLDRR